MRFFRALVLNRLGQILLGVHFVLVVYLFGQKSPAVVQAPCFIEPTANGIVWAGRFFFFESEPLLLKVTVILDAPALLLANLVRFYIFPRGMCPYTQSWWYAGVSLLFTSIQWLIVGLAITLIIRRLKTQKPALIDGDTQQIVGRERRGRVS